jgi:hypothetical protein
MRHGDRKAAVLAAFKRSPTPGFGALFCFAVAKALAEPPPLNEAELLLPTLTAPEPPVHCPCCTMAVHGARRVDGEWTWNCAGGCNP